MSTETRWLMLIHQIPPKPDYLRVKIWRRLQGLGAVPVKNSVYVLPRSDAAVEDFQWVAREIKSAGGDAMLCETRLVDGLTDAQIEASFRDARDADYRAIAAEARELTAALPAERVRGTADLARFRKRIARVASIDYFAAEGRAEAERSLAALERRLRPAVVPGAPAPRPAGKRPGRTIYSHRTWVTRRGIHVDRMACAWLIRRFIDPRARFRFVPAAGYRPRPREVRFDMYDAEFTHEGEKCTFEVLIDRFAADDAALRVIAEIVHDIDLKDSRFDREETPGVDRLIAGIAMGSPDDETRRARGSELFDSLYEYFSRKRR